MIRLSPLLALLFLLSGQTGLSAQRDPESSSIRFRVLPWEVYIGEIYYKKGNGYERLRGQPNGISHEYTYSGPDPMLLYRKTTDAEGMVVYQPYTSIPFRANERNNLLILYRNPADPQFSLGMLYPFNFEAKSKSPLLLFNMTSFPVKIQLGPEVIDLQPGQNAAFGKADNTSLSIRCKMAAQLDGKWKLIYNRAISTPPRGNLYFFFRGTNPNDEYAENMPIRVLKVVDYPLSEEQRVTMSLDDQPIEVEVGGY